MEKKLALVLVGVAILLLIVVYGGSSLKERFSIAPTAAPTNTARVTPTVAPVTFAPEEGTVEKISGRTLTLTTIQGAREVKVGDAVPVYKFLSAGSDEAPPLSEEVGFAAIKVGDKLTLFWTDKKELKAIYVSYG